MSLLCPPSLIHLLKGMNPRQLFNGFTFRVHVPFAAFPFVRLSFFLILAKMSRGVWLGKLIELFYQENSCDLGVIPENKACK